VVLKAGDHVAQVHFDTGGFSLNYLNFVLVSTCVDIPPDTTYTCAQQVGWGKCNEPWMDGYCKKSCGQCK
jgi:hypothetical protein